jgi:enoyl-CoA hydratase
MPYQHILVDDPRARVRRITLNRPEKRNALNNRLRAEVFEVLEAADRDGDVSITILRGAGPCFSAGYDLSSDNSVEQPYHWRQGRANGRGMSSRAGSRSGIWQNP